MVHGFKTRIKGRPGQLDIFGDDCAQSADFLATPYELVHQLLSVRPDLAGGVAAEPCAGNGALIRHWNWASKSLGLPATEWRYAVEIRDERRALGNLATHVWTPQDVTDPSLPVDPDVTIAPTNLPWFDGVIPVAQATWKLWPNAELVGLCSTFFYLQTEKEPRARWMHDHRPEEILHVPTRVQFQGQRGRYNQPVAWHRWLPGGVRGSGHWDMLLEQP